MIVFACVPGKGSEPGVGWALVRALAHLASESGRQATVICRTIHRERIASALDAEGLRDRVELIDFEPRVGRAVTRRILRIGYIAWQLEAAMRLHVLISRRREAAILHHVTFATEGLPAFESMVARAFTVRIFGPAGSSQELNSRSARGVLSAFVRRCFARTNLRGAAIRIAQNDDAAASWSRYGRVLVEPAIVIEENARQTAIHHAICEHDVVSVGELVPRKRHDLVINAVATNENIRLAIIGEGPEKAALQELISAKGAAERIQLLGRRPREETLARIAGASALVLASRQEGAPWVIGEAQAVGTVPVAFRGSGADTLIRIAGGLCVSESMPSDLASAIAEALTMTSSATEEWSEARLEALLATWYLECDNLGPVPASTAKESR